MRKIDPGPERLVEMLETMTTSQIAEECGVTRHTVENWIGKYKIRVHCRRNAAPTGHAARVQTEFDPVVIEFSKRRIGRPFGGPDWHSVGGIYMARTEQ